MPTLASPLGEDEFPEGVGLGLGEVVALGLGGTAEDVVSHARAGVVVPASHKPNGHSLFAGGHVRPRPRQMLGAVQMLKGDV